MAEKRKLCDHGQIDCLVFGWLFYYFVFFFRFAVKLFDNLMVIRRANGTSEYGANTKYKKNYDIRNTNTNEILWQYTQQSYWIKKISHTIYPKPRSCWLDGTNMVCISNIIGKHTLFSWSHRVSGAFQSTTALRDEGTIEDAAERWTRPWWIDFTFSQSEEMLELCTNESSLKTVWLDITKFGFNNIEATTLQYNLKATRKSK